MGKEMKRYIDIDIIKQLMQEKNIDAKKMAELMKVTPLTVKRLLNGGNQRRYTIVAVFRIARALDVSIPMILHKDNY